MANDLRAPARLSFWSILLYGLALGLLLASLQAARYSLLFLDHSLELYLGLIAILFTLVGIWTGFRLRRRRPGEIGLLPEDAAAAPRVDKTLEHLGITPREFEVLQCIAQGLSNQEIAARMFVSLNTVKTHVSNLFAKLDAQRRTQAVEKARTLGLLAGAHPKV